MMIERALAFVKRVYPTDGGWTVRLRPDLWRALAAEVEADLRVTPMEPCEAVRVRNVIFVPRRTAKGRR